MAERMEITISALMLLLGLCLIWEGCSQISQTHSSTAALNEAPRRIR